MTQKIYWSKMSYYKYACFYLNGQKEAAVYFNRIIQIFTAVASACSIAAWSTWTNLAYWWGLIIVISQVVSTINEFLPYKRRIEELTMMIAKIDSLYLEVEKNWFCIASGYLTDTEINELTYKFADQFAQIDSKYFANDSLPQKYRIQKKAEEQTEKYFNVTFLEKNE